MDIHWERYKYPLKNGAIVDRVREVVVYEDVDLMLDDDFIESK